jgi:hypothetical protein
MPQINSIKQSMIKKIEILLFEILTFLAVCAEAAGGICDKLFHSTLPHIFRRIAGHPDWLANYNCGYVHYFIGIWRCSIIIS